jgi:ankyrin repeat protein
MGNKITFKSKKNISSVNAVEINNNQTTTNQPKVNSLSEPEFRIKSNILQSLKIYAVKSIIINDIQVNNKELPVDLQPTYDIMKIIYKSKIDVDMRGINIENLDKMFNKHKHKLLDDAILNDDIELVEYLINQNAYIDNEKIYFILCNIKKENLDMVKLLYKNGLELDLCYSTVIEYLSKYPSILKFIINDKTDKFYLGKLLDSVIKKNNFESIKYLVEECNADPNNGISSAASENRLEIIKYLVNHGAVLNNIDISTYELYKFLHHDNVELIEYLIKNGLDIINNKESIDYAIHFNKIKIFKYLIKNGNKINDNTIHNIDSIKPGEVRDYLLTLPEVKEYLFTKDVFLLKKYFE